MISRRITESVIQNDAACHRIGTAARAGVLSLLTSLAGLPEVEADHG